MSELTTATFRHAQALHQRLKLKQRLAYNILSDQGGGLIHVHFDAIWNDDDAKALEAFEDHAMQLQGLQKLPM